MHTKPEPNPQLVLSLHLRKKHATATKAGCSAVIVVLLFLLTGLIALDTPAILWFLGPVFIGLFYIIVAGLIKQRREVRDESRWAIERTEYRPRQAWRVVSGLGDEKNAKWYGYYEVFVFREESGRWAVLLPIPLSNHLDQSKMVDWKNGIPASITVDFISSYRRIGEIVLAGETFPLQGTIALSGPSVLRTDAMPIYRVERFEDLPPELTRQIASSSDF